MLSYLTLFTCISDTFSTNGWRSESGKTADSEAVKDEIYIYDDIELKQQEHELGLKENAAYVPVQ